MPDAITVIWNKYIYTYWIPYYGNLTIVMVIQMNFDNILTWDDLIDLPLLSTMLFFQSISKESQHNMI